MPSGRLVYPRSVNPDVRTMGDYSPIVRQLRDEQKQTIQDMLSRTYTYLRLGTGVGKLVVMVFAAVRLAHAGERVLLLVPNSTMEQIPEEMTLWPEITSGLQHTISLWHEHRQDRLERIRSDARIILASHENLSDPALSKAIKEQTWGMVVLDEASRFRKWSQRTKALVGQRGSTGLKAKRRVIMSGTLTQRNPRDLWYPMRWLKPGIFGTTRRDVFIPEYCELGGYTGREPIDIRPDREEKLKAILNAVSTTINLSDVRKDMPPRVLNRLKIPLHPKQQRAYDELYDTMHLEIPASMRDALDWIHEGVRPETLAERESFELEVETYVSRLQRLQEIASGFSRNTNGDVTYLQSAKTDELVEQLIENPVPTIVWTWWIPERTAILARLNREGIRFTQDYREFNAPGSRRPDVLVLQLSSGGYGLNIDRAERMIYHSLCWDLDVYVQSQERNWRFTTQKAKEILHLSARNTVDEYQLMRLLQKAVMALKLNDSDALKLLVRRFL